MTTNHRFPNLYIKMDGRHWKLKLLNKNCELIHISDKTKFMIYFLGSQGSFLFLYILHVHVYLKLTRKGSNRDIISLGSCLLSLFQFYRYSVSIKVWWPKVWQFLIALLKGADLVCNETHTLQHLFRIARSHSVVHKDTLMSTLRLKYRLDHRVVP